MRLFVSGSLRVPVPDNMNRDEAIVHEFAIELLRNKVVSDPAFAAAEARFEPMDGTVLPPLPH